MKQLQYEGEDQDDFDALKRHMEQLSQDYALVLEDNKSLQQELNARLEELKSLKQLGF